MNLPRNFRFEALLDAMNEKNHEERKLVAREKLQKVAGGLYRIRDDYTSVWSLEADNDGRQYIIRADDNKSPDRLYLAEEDSNAGEKTAQVYMIEKKGSTHVVWECPDCRVANMTAYGNPYECDMCHSKPGDVLSREEKRVSYSREEAAAKFGAEFAHRMVREGISIIDQSLVDVWMVEAKGGPWDKPWNRQKKDKPKGGFSKVKRERSEEEDPYKEAADKSLKEKILDRLQKDYDQCKCEPGKLSPACPLHGRTAVKPQSKKPLQVKAPKTHKIH